MELLAAAKNAGRPVLVDFSADWCVACHELEEFTYTDEKVMSEGQRFELLLIDATKVTDQVKDLQKRFGVVGLPTVLFIGADGHTQNSLTVTGFLKASEFLSRMQKVQ
jgi:thiol:disulfide interchange protein DsbD